MQGMTFGHGRQIQCACYESMSHPLGCYCVILRNELHDLAQISESVIGDQDLASHPRIIADASAAGRTRPSATSAMPRSNAASNCRVSGSGSSAMISAASNARSRGGNFEMAVLISWRVLMVKCATGYPRQTTGERIPPSGGLVSRFLLGRCAQPSTGLLSPAPTPTAVAMRNGT